MEKQSHTTAAAAVRPVCLRFEHHREAQALGIGTSRPRISWRFEGSEPGWTQARYELEITRLRPGVCTAPEIETETATYSIPSPASVLVPWPGSPLGSGEATSVRVRAFPDSDDCAAPTAWSQPAIVEAGLLQPQDWTCDLVQSRSPTQSDPASPHCTVLFRRTFNTSPSEIQSARLHITAHGVYEAYINGVRVGDHVLAPGWTSYQHLLPYQTFDVTQHLQNASANVLGVLVGEGWYAGRLGFLGGQRNIWGDRLGVIAQLTIHYADGTVSSVQTDKDWSCRHDSAVLCSEIYDGEHYDARQARLLDGWSTPAYDADTDVAPSDGSDTDSTWQPVEAVPHDTALLRAPDGPPIRRCEDVRAVAALRSPTGKRIIDFGQNLVGWVRLRTLARHTAAAAAAGLTIRIRLTHAEVLENGEVATRPLRIAKATDIVILDGAEPLDWEPRFTFHGFRYVQVDVEAVQEEEQGGSSSSESDGAVSAVYDALFDEDSFQNVFTAVVIHSDMARSGWFECSEPLLNKLHENIVWSMRGNFVGVPTDCPQRDERLGWTGDLQAFAPAACYLYDVNGVLQTWLRGLTAEQAARTGAEAGVPPLFSPNTMRDWPGQSVAIWGDSVVLVPWDLFQSSGDVQVLQDQYASMQDWLSKGVIREAEGVSAEGDGDGDGKGEGKDEAGSRLWEPMNMQLGDWLDPIAPPSEPGNGLTDSLLVANAFLIRTTDRMADIASTLGRAAEERKYRRDAAALRRAFADEFVTHSGRVVSDSQTALALALHFSLLSTPDQEAHAAERLVQLIRSKTRFKIGTGFAGTPVLGHALTKAGATQVFYRMLLHRRCPSWLYPVSMGATTMWERWDSMLPDGTVNPGEMTSFNHYAYGAVAHWMHTVIGGLQPLVPGWKRFVVRPIPGGSITHASQRFDSPYGRIELSWKLLHNSTRLHLRLSVPPSTTARIELPGTDNVPYEVGCGVHETEVPYSAPAWPVLPIYAPFMPHDDDEP